MKLKWRSLTKNQAVLFVLAWAGVFAAVEPFVLPTLVARLPAPTVYVKLDGRHVASGHEQGCTVYLIEIISPRETLDQLVLTIQFPRDIIDYRFGGENFAVYAGPVERLSSAFFRFRKQDDGECKIQSDTITSSPEFTAGKRGPGVIQIDGNRIIPQTAVSGLVVMSVKPPSVNPAEMHIDGYFTYLRLGVIPVSKPLLIDNRGVLDMASAP